MIGLNNIIGHHRPSSLTPPPTDGLVAHWSMRRDGTTVFDDEGDNDGTAVGAPSIGILYGVREAGVRMDTGKYITVGDVAPLKFDRTSAFSFSLWVRSDNVLESGALEILSKQENSGNFRGYAIDHLGLSGANTFRFVMRSGNQNEVAADTATLVYGNVWRHLAIAHSGSGAISGLDIYVNGAPVSVITSENTLTTTIDNSAPFQLSGRSGANRSFVGDLDEIRIYDRALSAGEVLTLYDWDKTGAGH